MPACRHIRRGFHFGLDPTFVLIPAPAYTRVYCTFDAIGINIGCMYTYALIVNTGQENITPRMVNAFNLKVIRNCNVLGCSKRNRMHFWRCDFYWTQI